MLPLLLLASSEMVWEIGRSEQWKVKAELLRNITLPQTISELMVTYAGTVFGLSVKEPRT